MKHAIKNGIAGHAVVRRLLVGMLALLLLGLACVWAKAETFVRVLDEFQRIVLTIVTRIVIPLLPIYIACTFCGLAYDSRHYGPFAVIAALRRI